jgi:oligopeptide transport system ATP-binding protein
MVTENGGSDGDDQGGAAESVSPEAAVGSLTPEDMRRAATAAADSAAVATAPSGGVGRNKPFENTLVEVKDLRMYFPVTSGLFVQRKVADIKAVDGLSFEVKEGETLGLVGESGCGKSTTGRAILQLYEPTGGEVWMHTPQHARPVGAPETRQADRERGRDDIAAAAGVKLEGDRVNLTTLKGRTLRRYRRQMQMIFQDPYASLNPRMSVGSIVGEPMAIHGLHKGRRKERVREILETVGLNPFFASRYPHEFSGGQRQRIGIARALAVEPAFIVADEPVSALDVSIQAQIINLMEDLQADFGLTYLFIAHDLSVVRHTSHRIAVMYLGKIVELADSDELYENPLHPYTQALISAVPIPDPTIERQRERIVLTGDVPSPLAPPPGCNFHTRCPIAIDVCREEDPEWREISPDHFSKCHRI